MIPETVREVIAQRLEGSHLTARTPSFRLPR